MYDLSDLITAIEEAVEHYKRELAGIRTGKASPAILDGVKVDSYGTQVPLNQVASITIEGARTLRISPWDQSQLHPIEAALKEADLGLSIGADDKGVRASFPELTSDRRDQLMKLTRQKLEEARKTNRVARDKTWQDIQKQEKDGAMSEDDKFRSKERMEEEVKKGNDALEDLAKRKETELQQ